MPTDLADRLRDHVERLAGLIGPRHVGQPSSMTAAQALIERSFTECGDEPRRETYLADGHEVANLIIERTGRTRPREILVVGAHYDTIPTTPGADDNASAVAVLLESARLLAGRSLRRTVRFVAFACEEPPSFYTPEMGSAVHARGCRLRGERLVGMLCLEMVGYFTDAPRSQQLPRGTPRWLRWLTPTRGNFLAAVGDPRSWRLCWRLRVGFKRATRLKLVACVLPRSIAEVNLSDHSSFWDEGYPAVMITDTSFLRNPHYHLPSDTPATLDYDRMAEATRGLVGAIEHIAGR